MAQKITHEYVSAYFKANGYILLSEYVNSRIPLSYICPENHMIRGGWNGFRNGQRCKQCYTNSQVLSASFVRQSFEAKGHQMLGEYVRSHLPIRLKCKNGHEHQMTWANFKRGNNCGQCSKNEERLPQDFIESKFAEKGFKVLSEYQNNNTPILFECSNGHHHKMTWTAFQRGYGCAKCSGRHCGLSEVKDAFHAEGYRIQCDLEDIVEGKTLISFVCPQGHKHSITWRHFKNGIRCGKCFASTHNGKAVTRSRAANGILSSILREIKRQNIKTTWKDYYTLDLVEEIASPLNSIYKNCPKGYHVDHIVPVSYFNLLEEDALKKCWDPRNLRYLPATKNLSRGNKINKKELSTILKLYPDILLAAERRDPSIPIQIPLFI